MMGVIQTTNSDEGPRKWGRLFASLKGPSQPCAPPSQPGSGFKRKEPRSSSAPQFFRPSGIQKVFQSSDWLVVCLEADSAAPSPNFSDIKASTKIRFPFLFFFFLRAAATTLKHPRVARILFLSRNFHGFLASVRGIERIYCKPGFLVSQSIEIIPPRAGW